MASIIIALFDCPEEAGRVAEDLTDCGVPRDDVHFAGGGPNEAEGLAESLIQLGVPEDDARNYRDGVAGGGALLLVRAEEADAPRVRDLIDRAAHGDGYAGPVEARGADWETTGQAPFDESEGPRTTPRPQQQPHRQTTTRKAAAEVAACDSTEFGQAVGGYGTRGGATAFGGVERVEPRTRTPDAAKR